MKYIRNTLRINHTSLSLRLTTKERNGCWGSITPSTQESNASAENKSCRRGGTVRTGSFFASCPPISPSSSFPVSFSMSYFSPFCVWPLAGRTGLSMKAKLTKAPLLVVKVTAIFPSGTRAGFDSDFLGTALALETALSMD